MRTAVVYMKMPITRTTTVIEEEATRQRRFDRSADNPYILSGKVIGQFFTQMAATLNLMWLDLFRPGMLEMSPTSSLLSLGLLRYVEAWKRYIGVKRIMVSHKRRDQ